jgi:cytochrome P450
MTSPLIERLRFRISELGNLAHATAGHAPAAFEPIHEDLHEFVTHLKAWGAAHPEAVFSLLRRLPIQVLKGQALVTRYRDVQEVLARNEVFGTTYEPGFTSVTAGGAFFLGMDNTPTYTRDASNMRIAVRREDIPERVGQFVDRTAQRLVADAPGAIDVVDLGQAVVTAWVTDYFGITSPGPKDFAKWSTILSAYLFLRGQPGAPSESVAVDAGTRMCAEIDRQIAARKASRTRRDDVLERCLAMQDAGLPGMDDLTLRNNLVGVIVGAIPTTVATSARAVDELLRRPDQLAHAQAAARDDNDPVVRQYVFEALRFNPIGPGVVRVARRDYELAAGTVHAHTIPKGTVVVAAIQSAMFDEDAVKDPQDFRIDRPPDLNMQFGYGLHTCFGQYINAVQIPAIVKALLKRPNLRRAAAGGALIVDGPFPSSLRVEFDPASR